MMEDWITLSVGFSSQLLFSTRTFYQWFASEKQKKVVAPAFFWQISLLASFLLFLYGDLRDDFPIMLGQTITYFIYIRNLQILDQWKYFPKILRYAVIAFPVIMIAYYLLNDENELRLLIINSEIPRTLFILGVTSQVLFTFRFVYQWIHSEVRHSSGLPLGFWLISLTGSSLILIYGILRQDIVLILGNLFGMIVYIRNLMLLRKSWKKE